MENPTSKRKLTLRERLAKGVAVGLIGAIGVTGLAACSKDKDPVPAPAPSTSAPAIPGATETPSSQKPGTPDAKPDQNAAALRLEKIEEFGIDNRFEGDRTEVLINELGVDPENTKLVDLIKATTPEAIVAAAEQQRLVELLTIKPEYIRDGHFEEDYSAALSIVYTAVWNSFNTKAMESKSLSMTLDELQALLMPSLYEAVYGRQASSDAGVLGWATVRGGYMANPKDPETPDLQIPYYLVNVIKPTSTAVIAGSTRTFTHTEAYLDNYCAKYATGSTKPGNQPLDFKISGRLTVKVSPDRITLVDDYAGVTDTNSHPNGQQVTT